MPLSFLDTLHRFWKKEHDWGWKKFMELSKVYDGFVDTSDNLIIKAQVQVIRYSIFNLCYLGYFEYSVHLAPSCLNN